MPRFCSSCGNSLPDIGKFCPKCGQPIAADSVPPSEEIRNQTEQPRNPYVYQFTPPQGQSQAQSWPQPQNQGAPQPISQNLQQNSANGVASGAQKKKSKAGLIVCLVFLLLAGLAAVACFVWPGFLKENAPETNPGSSASVTAPTATEPLVTTTEIPVRETQPTLPPATEPAVTEPVVTEPVVTEPVNPFLDVTEDDPCYEEYLWAHAHGVLEGQLLEGDKILTRGETLIMLWKACGSPAAAENDMPFGDISAADECYPAVLWAVHSHLVSVPGDGTFKPDNKMTRDQTALILCNTVGGDGAGKPRAYLDVDADKYYYNAVNWGCAAGVLERYYDFSFRPTDPLLRADFACWLARAMEPELALDPAVPEGDELESYGIEINLHPHGVAYFNAETQEDSSVIKKLQVTAESYEIFEQAEGYEAKPGYEWRKGVFFIDYGETGANSYSYSIRVMVCDSKYVELFQNNRHREEDESESSWVICNGEPCKVSVSPLKYDRIEGSLFRFTYTLQVPVGYDGLVVRI